MFMNMKQLSIICAALLMCIAAGCEKQEEKPQEEGLKDIVCGEWHATIQSADAELYAGFASDGTFELYQKVGEGFFRLYKGKWEVENDIISGKYNDGSVWASAYKVQMSGKDSMVWTSQNDAAEKTAYKRTEIPEDVKKNSVVKVKSSSEDNYLL